MRRSSLEMKTLAIVKKGEKVSIPAATLSWAAKGCWRKIGDIGDGLARSVIERVCGEEGSLLHP